MNEDNNDLFHRTRHITMMKVKRIRNTGSTGPQPFSHSFSLTRAFYLQFNQAEMFHSVEQVSTGGCAGIDHTYRSDVQSTSNQKNKQNTCCSGWPAAPITVLLQIQIHFHSAKVNPEPCAQERFHSVPLTGMRR